MKRFSAVLLFQFRKTGSTKKRRLCELRIITFKKRSAREALAHARRHGKADEINWVHFDGKRVYREFVGVAELMDLAIGTTESEREEVRTRRAGTLRLNPLY